MKMWAVLVLSAFAFVSGASSSYAADAFPARTSDAGGVKVVVTPKALSATAKFWEFAIVLDTHTKPLNEDIAKLAVLVDQSGQRYMPAAWQGDPPGGHHRKGVLGFTAPSEMPEAIELQIAKVGGVPTRSFRWKLK